LFLLSQVGVVLTFIAGGKQAQVHFPTESEEVFRSSLVSSTVAGLSRWLADRTSATVVAAVLAPKVVEHERVSCHGSRGCWM
jgi:hypothetical protein